MIRCLGQALPAFRRETVAATPAAARKLPGVVLRGRGLPGDSPAAGRDWDLWRKVAGKDRWCHGFHMGFTGSSISKDRQWVKSQKWLEHWDSRQPRLGFKAAKIVIYGARLCVRWPNCVVLGVHQQCNDIIDFACRDRMQSRNMVHGDFHQEQFCQFVGGPSSLCALQLSCLHFHGKIWKEEKLPGANMRISP